MNTFFKITYFDPQIFTLIFSSPFFRCSFQRSRLWLLNVLNEKMLISRQAWSYLRRLGLYRISGWPDIRPFFISGIRPDIWLHLPDIRLNCWTNNASFERELISEPFRWVYISGQISIRYNPNLSIAWQIRFFQADSAWVVALLNCKSRN